MSLTVSIDGVLRLEDIVTADGRPLYRAAGYASLKSAQNAVARGTFPIARIQGDARIRFTVTNVVAYTQRGQVTNKPKIRQFFGKAHARVVNR